MSQDTADFLVGGETISVGSLTIRTLKVCWPHIQEFGRAKTQIESNDLLAKIIAGASGRTVDEIEERMRLTETGHNALQMVQLLRISGMVPRDSGEAPAATNLLASTGTGTESRPN